MNGLCFLFAEKWMYKLCFYIGSWVFTTNWTSWIFKFYYVIAALLYEASRVQMVMRFTSFLPSSSIPLKRCVCLAFHDCSNKTVAEEKHMVSFVYLRIRASFDVKQRQLFSFFHFFQSFSGDCILISAASTEMHNIFSSNCLIWGDRRNSVHALCVSDIPAIETELSIFSTFSIRNTIEILVNGNALNFKNEFVLFFRFIFIYLLDVLGSVDLIMQLLPHGKDERKLFFFFRWMKRWTVRNRNECFFSTIFHWHFRFFFWTSNKWIL